MNDMRIAMFTDTYTPQINGVVTSILAFKSELKRQGHDVHVWAPAVKNVSSDESVHRIRSFSFAPYPEYKISVPNPRLLHEFERFMPDIVHVHTPISVGAAGIGLARYFGLPTLGTFHTLLPEYLHYIVRHSLQKIFLAPARRFAWGYCRWFYNMCDAVIAPSYATASLLKEKGISKPIAVVPTGIPIRRRRVGAASFRSTYGLSGPLLLHVGRVTKEKNIEAIMDAIRELPYVTLAVASDGPHRAELQKYAKRQGIAERVRFLGYLSRDELDAAYAASDLFVCASQSETQGIVLLEAAVAGLPIAALDTPVVSDFVRENRAGIITAKESFARAIEMALGDKRLRSRAKKRARFIAEKYSIERCAKALANLYERCIDEANGKKA